ncbi:MAG: hypothetical protein LBS84_02855 [Clostridiales bacterium]|jgi:hypothetical protein|nr:hypothetical protein [Clostridiales bacterium]
MTDIYDNLVDIRRMPFGRRGSYMTIYLDDITDGTYANSVLYLGTARGESLAYGKSLLLLITPVYNGRPVPYSIQTTSAVLKLETLYGFIEFCMAEERLIRIRGKGVGLRLERQFGNHECAREMEEGCWEVIFRKMFAWLLVPIIGTLTVDAPYKWLECGGNYMKADFSPEEGGVFEAAIQEYDQNGRKRAAFDPFDVCVTNVMSDFEAERETLPCLHPEYRHRGDMAAWTLWSCTLPPVGFVKEPMITMGRMRGITQFYGWQQSYQAMIHSKDIQYAWRLLVSMFNHQDDAGQLPDFINGVIKNYATCKAPFQGFVIDWLLNNSDISGISKEQIAELYYPLCRWTRWWFDYRDLNHDGIPEYNHGDESGDDDSSIMRMGIPVSCPELCAYLALQMEMQGKLAKMLALNDEAEKWLKRSKEMIALMIDTFWIGDRFVAYQGRNMENLVDAESISRYKPLMLGKRLPKDIRKKMLADLCDENKYLSSCGITSEAMDSPDFLMFGSYMHGPVVAPVQFLMTVAIHNAGDAKLAKEVARRYCDAVNRYGAYQMFNPYTGMGVETMRDSPARRAMYTSWASGIFLFLAEHYADLSMRAAEAAATAL